MRMKRNTLFAWLVILPVSGPAILAGQQNTPNRQGRDDKIAPPEVFFQDAGYTVPARLPDGRLIRFRTHDDGDTVSYTSNDGGRTWKKLEVEGKHRIDIPLVDKDGELHTIALVWRNKAGKRIAVDRFLDVWYARTTDHRTKWQAPRMIYKGYCGALMDFKQLGNGRLIVPFAYWVGGRPCAPPVGANVVTCYYSDDLGKTWKKSDADLTAPCYPNFNGNNYGADEPAILELKDGRLWMLMRTQTGFLYESYSGDKGTTWTNARPSRFHCSTSPPMLSRLADGRIIVIWNNYEMPPRHNGAGVYGGRDSLHAAISDDEGKTWRGFRDVYRDPFRNDPPPPRCDRGTAYPTPPVMVGGTVLFLTGQGPKRRNLISFDPRWLSRTHHRDDFSRGVEGWIVFKAFGPAKGYWRDRVQGPAVIDHPAKPGAKVLHIRRPDKRSPDGAVWNFPIGSAGKLTLRIMLDKDFAGGNIALNDHCFNPCDDNGERAAIFSLAVRPDGRIAAGPKLECGRWYTIGLDWDLSKRACDVLVDGKPAAKLELLNETGNGICYLRLRSTAKEIDRAGYLVDSVSVDIRQPIAPARTAKENQLIFQKYRPSFYNAPAKPTPDEKDFKLF